MSWTIAEVARMSRVTSRTLRHYDAIGLLPPAYVGRGGYRYYGEAELLRLQRILVLRELGMGLDGIAAVLAEGGDETAALRAHHAELSQERDRLARLVRTVERTIAERERSKGAEQTMTRQGPEAWFDGFEPDRYEQEARDRWGDNAVDESNRQVARLTDAEKAALQERFESVVTRMADLLDEGVPTDDPRTLAAVAEHYRWVSTFWTPDADAYSGLGRLYVDDPRFREVYDGTRTGLADYLADAMTAYALVHLVD
ncbi:MerR family transcriptional regulator [Streptomycetaceae bacterium NBC_01309]